MKPTVGSLFAGIGGFDLGVERAGCQVDWQVEIDPWCRQVLAKHWPEVPRYEDIKKVGAHNLKPVDWIVGGFPCQDLSTASMGKQKGLQGDRSGLWWQMRRVIGELRPEIVIVENVPNLVNLGIEHVLGSLAQIGYDAEWDIVSAQDIGAPHLRKRIWIVAHTMRPRLERHTGHEFDRNQSRRFDPRSNRPLGGKGLSIEQHWLVEPTVGRVANGIPKRMDRLRGLGNAVVPQVVEWIARRIITENGNDVTANSNCRADGERGACTVQSLRGSSEATAEGERVGDDNLPRPLCHR